MTEVISLAIAGAVSGGLYAILAAGLVLTYQASGIFNIGHGAIAFVSALAFYVLNSPASSGGLDLPTWLAALIAIVLIAPLLGLALDVVIFRRLADAPEAARLVGAIGVLIAVPSMALLLIDFINKVFGQDLPNAAGESGLQPPGLGPFPAKSYTLTTGVSVDSNQLAVLAAAAVSAVGLWYLLRRTRLGLETRAGVDRAGLARLRGIDTDRSSRIVWALTAGLAGLAGVLIAPLFDLSDITFHMLVFVSCTAAVAARLRSVPVAFGAGITLGVIQNLVNGYAPDVLADISGFRSSIPFLLLFVLLFFVQGRGRAAGSIAEDSPPTDPRSDLSPWRRRVPWGVGAVALLAYGFLLADAYWTGILNKGLVLGLVFLSFVVVTGLGGMISLAQATFVTVGGFCVGWLVNHQWTSTVPVIMTNGRFTFWMATLVAVVVTLAVGLLVALPSLRLGGLTLALATLALAFVGDRLVFQLNGVRNGSKGWSVPRPAYGPVDLANDKTLMVVLLIMVILGCGLIGNLQRSATGRAVLALRSSPVAAATAGLDPMRTKLTIFAVSAAMAGFAGAMYAMVTSPITNSSAPPILGLVWLAVAVTFGIRRPGGAVVAGLVYAIFPAVLVAIANDWQGAPWSWLPDTARELLGSSELAAMLFGLGAIGLARQPDGVLADIGQAFRTRRLSKVGRSPSQAEQEVDRTTSPASDDADRAVAGADVGDGTDVVLAVTQVHAGYGEVEVLHGVNLGVGPGEALAVLGANGAGKSTLASVFGGSNRPGSGTVWLSDQDVTATPSHVRARSGLLVAPEARGVFPGLSVEDNLAVTLRSSAARNQAYERFPILGERRRQLAGLLSGGEQQLLSLAGALENPPKVFVVDEPSLGLAPMAAQAVFDALADLKALGTALVLIEEQAGGALALADRVVIMDLGTVSWSGPADQLDLDRLGATYLGA